MLYILYYIYKNSMMGKHGSSSTTTATTTSSKEQQEQQQQQVAAHPQQHQKQQKQQQQQQQQKPAASSQQPTASSKQTADGDSHEAIKLICNRVASRWRCAHTRMHIDLKQEHTQGARLLSISATQRDCQRWVRGTRTNTTCTTDAWCFVCGVTISS